MDCFSSFSFDALFYCLFCPIKLCDYLTREEGAGHLVTVNVLKFQTPKGLTK